MSGLNILAVDDERPALEELVFLLEGCDLAGRVHAVSSVAEALQVLESERVELVLLDIAMPGLDGLSLARLLARFAEPPAVAFVTAHERHAVEAFDVGAIGYLLKPLDRSRLERLLARVVHERRPRANKPELDVLSLEQPNGTVHLVAGTDVLWVEAAGDYVRVHLRDGTSHLLHLAMALLEQEWSEHGFARVHRRYLVALREISELRADEGGTSVVLGGTVIPVSRRHLRELRDRLVRSVRAPRPAS